MKKIAALVLSAAVMSAAASPAFAANFSDVSEKTYPWAADYIDEMYDNGYITGYEDGTFRPDNEVTRLECIALFARAMGSNDSSNAATLAMAHESYDDLISAYSLPWGADEIAYMLYKGALIKSDLDTYLLSTEKDAPMKRHEAAIIITKALGGETEALANSAIALDYTDAKDIPRASVQYVNYVTEAGIMNGMGDGSFSPASSVSRAQMAVMLARTVEATEYEFFTAKLQQIDINSRNIVYILSDGDEVRAAYTDNTVFRVLGEETQAKLMPTSVRAIFTVSGDEVISVEALSDQPDEIVTGAFRGYSSSSGVMSVTITVNGETKAYECAPDVSVVYSGSPATIRSFKTGDAIELSLSDGKVTSISGNESEITISNATIENMEIGEVIRITISSSNSEYDGKTFDVSGDVKVLKNGTSTDLTKIYTGDTVQLTLRYNVVQRITATASKQTLEGTIVSITYAVPNSSMVVAVRGEDRNFIVPADTDITVNNEEASLYDFRVGDVVKITTESNAITKIVATSTSVTAGSLVGTVSGISTSYKLITLAAENGASTGTSFMYTDKTTFITSSGVSKKASDIKQGQTISVRGSMSGGSILVAELVIIETESN